MLDWIHCLGTHYYPAQPIPQKPGPLESFRFECSRPGFRVWENIRLVVTEGNTYYHYWERRNRSSRSNHLITWSGRHPSTLDCSLPTRSGRIQAARSVPENSEASWRLGSWSGCRQSRALGGFEHWSHPCSPPPGGGWGWCTPCPEGPQPVARTWLFFSPGHSGKSLRNPRAPSAPAGQLLLVWQTCQLWQGRGSALSAPGHGVWCPHSPSNHSDPRTPSPDHSSSE